MSTCIHISGYRISPEKEPDRKKNFGWKSQNDKVGRNKSSADTCHQKVDRGKFFEQSVLEVVVAERPDKKPLKMNFLEQCSVRLKLSQTESLLESGNGGVETVGGGG